MAPVFDLLDDATGDALEVGALSPEGVAVAVWSSVDVCVGSGLDGRGVDSGVPEGNGLDELSARGRTPQASIGVTTSTRALGSGGLWWRSTRL
jgi:hypothetical protein